MYHKGKRSVFMTGMGELPPALSKEVCQDYRLWFQEEKNGFRNDERRRDSADNQEYRRFVALFSG